MCSMLSPPAGRACTWPDIAHNAICFEQAQLAYLPDGIIWERSVSIILEDLSSAGLRLHQTLVSLLVLHSCCPCSCSWPRGWGADSGLRHVYQVNPQILDREP